MNKAFVETQDGIVYAAAAGVILCCILICCVLLCKKICCKKKLGDDGKVDV